jgi:hypothetical protein
VQDVVKPVVTLDFNHCAKTKDEFLPKKIILIINILPVLDGVLEDCGRGYENIDDQLGSHNIPEEPPGPPPANPPPMPAEPETFGLGGTSNEPPVGLNNYGLPIARPQATDEEIFCCRWAVVDHLSMAQCTGFAGSSFNKVQHVWSSVQVSWVGAFSDAVGAIIDSLRMPHPNKRRRSLDLERKIIWKSLLPTLLL